MTSWSPSGNKNKKKVRARRLEKQQREYIQGLNPKQFQALSKVVADNESARPDDTTLAVWERLQERGRIFLDAIFEGVR